MIDIASGQWIEIKQALEQKIENARNQLERGELPERETQFWRGRIAAYREMLALPTTQGPRVPRMVDRTGM